MNEIPGVLAALILLSFIPAVAFPLVYAFYPWFRTGPGRSVMGLSLVIACSLALPFWRAFIGPPPDALRIPVYGLIVVALWAQLITLLLAPRMNRRRLARTRSALPPAVLDDQRP